MTQKKDKPADRVSSTLARLDDGTVQITVAIPTAQVETKRAEALKHLVENVEIPGFRKGKVPTDIASKHIDKQKLYEHTLQHLLTETYASVIKEHSLNPIISPRFELLSMEDDKDWSVRVVTCELPRVELGNYKEAVSGSGKAQAIWTPGKDKKKPEITREEKEQLAIKALFDSTDIKIPKIIIEDEVNHKLAQLLDQVQKLGLSIEQYLTSTGKTLEQIKADYSNQSADSLKLMLALNKIAEVEKITVTDQEIKEVIQTSLNSLNPQDEKTREELTSPEQQRLVRGILLRRRVLDSLVNLI